MAWAADYIPKYRPHARSGRAVVTIQGRDVYLGEYGTPSSRAEYRRVLAEYLAAGSHDPRPPAGSSLTWCELAARYLKFAEGYYCGPVGAASKTFLTIKGALPALLSLYGDTPVDRFGPLALKACRNQIVATGRARQTVNDYVRIFKRIVKWGVGEEIVPGRDVLADSGGTPRGHHLEADGGPPDYAARQSRWRARVPTLAKPRRSPP